jgi:dTDP-4-dehydrorhamnose reductase
MQTLLITGAKGMLGSALQLSLQGDYNIIAASHSELNIESFSNTKSYLSNIKPDIIIHSAAYTNVEEAELKPNECYKVNYSGTLNLLNSINSSKTKFVYISSTGCYGNYKNNPYSEFDDLNPTTVYHNSKVAGENLVKELSENYLILRTGWLFGGSIEHKKNFVYNRYKEANNRSEITSDPFQIGNPTYTGDVSVQIKKLLANDIKGVFNVVSEGYCSRYEYVKTLVDLFGLSCNVIAAQKPFDRLAKVSHNESALNFNLEQLGLNNMSYWKESLEKYILSIKSYV